MAEAEQKLQQDASAAAAAAADGGAADVAAGRLDGLIVQIQRIVNVDGYEILTLSRSENRIALNVPKLKRQFDLD